MYLVYEESGEYTLKVIFLTESREEAERVQQANINKWRSLYEETRKEKDAFIENKEYDIQRLKEYFAASNYNWTAIKEIPLNSEVDIKL